MNEHQTINLALGLACYVAAVGLTGFAVRGWIGYSIPRLRAACWACTAILGASLWAIIIGTVCLLATVDPWYLTHVMAPGFAATLASGAVMMIADCA